MVEELRDIFDGGFLFLKIAGEAFSGEMVEGRLEVVVEVGGKTAEELRLVLGVVPGMVNGVLTGVLVGVLGALASEASSEVTLFGKLGIFKMKLLFGVARFLTVGVFLMVRCLVVALLEHNHDCCTLCCIFRLFRNVY